MSRVGSDLYPTPTRLALLRDVDAGNVVFGLGPDGVPGRQARREPKAWNVADPARGPHLVAAAVDEMERAGWIERPDRTAEWRLTDTGREVLDGRRSPHAAPKELPA